MSGLKQRARIDTAVAAEIDAYMRRPCHRAPADGLTPLQRMTPLTKALADAEWELSDDRGRLPENWPQIKAAIAERFNGKAS